MVEGLAQLTRRVGAPVLLVMSTADDRAALIRRGKSLPAGMSCGLCGTRTILLQMAEKKFTPTPEQLALIRREELAANAIGSGHHAPPELVQRMTEEGRFLLAEEAVEDEDEGENAPGDDSALPEIEN